MQRLIRLIVILSCLYVSFCTPARAQDPLPAKSAAEILHALQKLKVLGSVLYVAAHPDDENQRLLAYFTGEEKFRAGYLSLTRGDGGQNLIGDEKGPLLGMLRTQELLAARRIDGAEQLFSRALDFGYSKHPDETLNVWNKEQVLADVVWAIRSFRPDVIITRFSPDRAGMTHGHHTTSAILAGEAFRLAGDPGAFPEQLKYTDVWQPKRILWNTWLPYRDPNYDFSQTLSVDIGIFNPLLGKSYGEIAAEARSMHKCQAFGAARLRGSSLEYLKHTAGELALQHPFEGVNTSWNRVKGGEEVEKWINMALADFDANAPRLIVPQLLAARQAMLQLPDGYWKQQKLKEVEQLIVYASGLWFEANSSQYGVANGDSVQLTFSALKRLPGRLALKGIELWMGNQPIELDIQKELTDNEVWQQKSTFLLQNMPVSQPYWLEKAGTKGMFEVADQRLIGQPESPPPLKARFEFEFGENQPVSMEVEVPVIHKYVDRAMGELYRPFVVLPALTTNIAENVYLFANDEPQNIHLLVKAHKHNLSGSLHIELPEGWQASPKEIPISFERAGDEKQYEVQVQPSSGQSEGKLRVTFSDGQATSSYSLTEIAYDHIPTQLIFNPAEAKVVRINLKKAGERIGYIMGSGDEIPACLRQVGYQVELLSDEEITRENLRKYDAVIAGIRVYNTNQRMPYLQQEIFEYVKEGGTYLVQYNTSYSISTEQPGPYPLRISRDRVAVEEAPVKILRPEHPVFNYPNKITEADFEGWVQERGLYFPNEWDERYEALTECNDPGESPKRGALLIAQLGKGYFIYTGFSWFRELPAGVPGAYRLFTNLISIGQSPDR